MNKLKVHLCNRVSPVNLYKQNTEGVNHGTSRLKKVLEMVLVRWAVQVFIDSW